MTETKQINDLIRETSEVINEAQAFLQKNGTKYSLGEWLTVKRYCQKFDIANTQTVTNWINRGIIPSENVVTLPELNNVRLIRAVPYLD